MAKRKRDPYAGQRGIKAGHWTRESHEQAAVRAMSAASKELGHRFSATHPGAGQCSPSTAYSVIRANRDIAQARVHLSAIGPMEGRRTSRLWAALQKVQRRVDEAGNYVAKCMGSDR
jgi:hypothetical protein